MNTENHINGRLTVRALEEMLNRDAFDFKCKRCGNCCRGGGNVYFSATDLRNIFKYLKLSKAESMSLAGKLVQHKLNGYFVHSSGRACHFLGVNNRCAVYPVRPLQCRTFPFWPSYFQSKDDVSDLKQECRGSLTGRGEEFTLLSTLRRINRTHREFLKPQSDKTRPITL